MNWHSISTVWLKELKDQLRDRRTVISMIVIPALVMPLFFIGMITVAKKVMSKAQAEAPSIMILGGEDSPAVVAALKAEKTKQGEPRFRIVVGGDYRKLISEKKLRAAVEIAPGFDASLAAGKPSTVTIYHYEGEIRSTFGFSAVREVMRAYQEKTVAARLAERGLPPDLLKPFDIKNQNVAPPEKVGGNVVGGFIPYIIILLCFTGAMYPAMDLTAGEKERGTMETLMCSPTPRINIVLGKFLMVLTASVGTMVVLLLSMGATFMLGGSLLGAKGGALAAAQSPAAKMFPPMTVDPMGIVGVFAMIVPVAILFAAVLLVASLFAKSYKEAQSYVSPLIIVVIMPAALGLMPGIELSAKTAMVPILNLSLVCKEMLSGVWNWQYIGLIFGSSCLYAVIALAVCVKMFNREDVMFRA